MSRIIRNTFWNMKLILSTSVSLSFLTQRHSHLHPLTLCAVPLFWNKSNNRIIWRTLTRQLSHILFKQHALCSHQSGSRPLRLLSTFSSCELMIISFIVPIEQQRSPRQPEDKRASGSSLQERWHKEIGVEGWKRLYSHEIFSLKAPWPPVNLQEERSDGGNSCEGVQVNESHLGRSFTCVYKCLCIDCS